MLLLHLWPFWMVIGMQKVYPVNMHITVNAYLFPFEEGIKSPIKSIEINSMGVMGAEKCPWEYLTGTMFCLWHNLHCLT